MFYCDDSIEFTAVWSGEVSNSCENDSNARSAPQIDSDSIYALVFFTLNLSANETEKNINDWKTGDK